MGILGRQASLSPCMDIKKQIDDIDGEIRQQHKILKRIDAAHARKLQTSSPSLTIMQGMGRVKGQENRKMQELTDKRQQLIDRAIETGCARKKHR